MNLKYLFIFDRIFIVTWFTWFSASPSTPLAFVIVFTPADLGMFLALVVVVEIHNAHIFTPYHTISWHFIPFLFFDGKKSLTMLSRVFISASPSTPVALVFVFTPTDQGMFLLLVVEVKLYNAHILIPYHTIS